VTWNRVLAGKWLDAQVGSDVLIGAALGSGLWVFFKAATIFLFHNNEPANWDVALIRFQGARQWLGAQSGVLNSSLALGLFVFLTIFGMRRLVRREIPAALAAAALLALAEPEVTDSGSIIVGLLFGAVFAALIFVLLRSGLVATVAAIFFVTAFDGMALGTDWRAWYMPASLATALLLLGIAIFAFWRSLGGRELLEGDA
jgi:hypothetical protein